MLSSWVICDASVCQRLFEELSKDVVFLSPLMKQLSIDKNFQSKRLNKSSSTCMILVLAFKSSIWRDKSIPYGRTHCLSDTYKDAVEQQKWIKTVENHIEWKHFRSFLSQK